MNRLTHSIAWVICPMAAFAVGWLLSGNPENIGKDLAAVAPESAPAQQTEPSQLSSKPRWLDQVNAVRKKLMETGNSGAIESDLFELARTLRADEFAQVIGEL